MMQPTPSQPHSNGTTFTRQRGTATHQQQQYTLHPQHHQSSQHNPYPPPGYRLGGNTPYRDDPNIDPSLESFTRGGFGPRHSMPPEKGKKLPIPRKVAHAITSFLCCPRSTNGSSSAYDDDAFYQDDFNHYSWSCSVGTSDEHGVWLNRSDPAGTMMSVMVWFLIGYSAFTMTFLAKTGGIPNFYSLLYCILATMALACHAKTSLTDPGAVPASAVPTEVQRQACNKLSMCSQCQTFKPPQSHHCRICNRCISRMDHHCPWMNNCVGAANMKHFVLFLIYTWTCSALCLLLLGFNYFFCADEECTFTVVLVQLVRLMTLLSVGAFLFTSSMLMNVCYGLMTGVGTIDRLKKKAQNTMDDSDEEQIPLKDVFGVGPFYTWPFPVDPIFEDFDRVMGYSTPQRLLREQMNINNGVDNHSVVSRDSYGIPM